MPKTRSEVDDAKEALQQTQETAQHLQEELAAAREALDALKASQKQLATELQQAQKAAEDVKTQAPPIAAAASSKITKSEHISMTSLVDIPLSYLYDRSNWPEFKKALRECGFAWNLQTG